VCVGVVGYYGYQYHYDTALQAAQLAALVLRHLVKTEHVNLVHPVAFFLIAASSCLINTLCFLIACTISPITALMITKTAYVSLTSINTPVMIIRSCLEQVYRASIISEAALSK
jgi:hypothetical protein